MTFPDSSAGKESACNVRDPGLIPGLGRSPGERKGYPLQYSGLENSMDCIVHGITKRRTRLSDFTMPTSTVLWISSLEPPLECCLCCDWKAWFFKHCWLSLQHTVLLSWKSKKFFPVLGSSVLKDHFECTVSALIFNLWPLSQMTVLCADIRKLGWISSEGKGRTSYLSGVYHHSGQAWLLCICLSEYLGVCI